MLQRRQFAKLENRKREAAKISPSIERNARRNTFRDTGGAIRSADSMINNWCVGGDSITNNGPGIAMGTNSVGPSATQSLKSIYY